MDGANHVCPFLSTRDIYVYNLVSLDHVVTIALQSSQQHIQLTLNQV